MSLACNKQLLSRLLSDCLQAVAIALIGICTSVVVGQTVIHVAPSGDDRADGSAGHPLKTLPRAQGRIAELRANGDSRWTRVEIAPGEYVLDAPLTIAGDESGESAEHPTTYAAVGGEARIFGGVRIKDFRQLGDRWVANIPRSLHSFRDLWVNGRRAVRARSPNSGLYRIAKAGPDNRTSFFVETKDLLSLAHPKSAELVFLHDWSISRVHMASIDAAAHSYQFADPIGAASKNFLISNFEAHPRYFVENAKELLDEPGEWFLDESTSELTYIPRSGEKIETAEFIAPQIDQLLIVRGDTGKPVEHICFEGITLCYARFDIPQHGYGGVQATLHEKRATPNDKTKTFPTAAVSLDRAADCQFKNCRFEHLGGTGLSATHCQDTRIERSRFSDIGGNGVMIGSLSTADTPVAERNIVENCTIENCGQTFFGAIGAWVGMSVETTLQNNEIRNLPYTGISVGWCWDARPTICRGHVIRDNNIHHVMQTLSDGGGIYTLGRQPGTVLTGNVIHDIQINSGRAESNGIFMDEGSTEIQVENNTIYRVARAAIRYNEAGKNTVANNRLDGASGGTWQPSADDALVKQAGPRP